MVTKQKILIVDDEVNELCNIYIVVYNEDFLFRGHVRAPFCLMEFSNRNAGIPFPKFPEAEGFHIFQAFQMVLYGFAERPGTLAVYNPHRRHMGKVSIVQIFVQFGQRFVYRFTQKINLRGYLVGLGHFNFTAGRPLQATYICHSGFDLKFLKAIVVATKFC